MTVKEIATDIQAGTRSRKPILIAVEGYGGAGKSTFAEKLKVELGDAYVVNVDDFIVKERLTKSSWDDGMLDRNRLEREVLDPFTNNRLAKYHRLIWQTNTFSKPITIPDVTYVIIEGISSYHPDLEHYYTHKIWIETPVEIAKQRGQARDGSNVNAAYWDIWTKNDLAYQAQYHPEMRADYVYENAS